MFYWVFVEKEGKKTLDTLALSLKKNRFIFYWVSVGKVDKDFRHFNLFAKEKQIK